MKALHLASFLSLCASIDCGGPRAPFAKPNHSLLAGDWLVQDFRAAIISPTTVEEAKPLRLGSEPVVVRVHPDGTFDWSGTSASPFERLRRPGDRLSLGPWSSDVVVLEWSEYTPLRTSLLFRIASGASGVDDDGNSRPIAHSRSLFLDLSLLDQDHAVYSAVLPVGPGESSTQVLRAMYLRRTTEHGRNHDPLLGPTPAELAASSVEILEDRTLSGGRYLLLLPRACKGNVPLIIVITCWPRSVESWLPIAARYRCGVLIPDERYADDYLIGAWNRQRAELDASAARESLETVRMQWQIGRVMLFSQGLGAPLAHLIWQTDNAGFDLFVAWDGEFRQWVADVGSTVDPTKPIYIWAPMSGRRDALVAQEWYSSYGYVNVRYELVESTEQLELEARFVAPLFGSHELPPEDGGR